MRLFLLAFTLAIPFFALSQRGTTVNAVIGDSSWLTTRGALPDYKTDETERISTHLNFVLERLKGSAAQSHPRSAKRKESIELLEEYIALGEFPSAFSFDALRTPCFIDDVGNICAVGFLIEKTVGRREAERINELYRFNYLADMDDEGLQTWQASSGLSMTELAMIQPAYGAMPSWSVFQDPKTKKYGLFDRHTKAMIIEPEYDYLNFHYNRPMYASMAGFHMNGLAKKNGKWGVINSKGVQVIPLTYDSMAKITPYAGYQIRSFDQTVQQTSFFEGYMGNTLMVLNTANEVLATFDLPKASIEFQSGPFFMVKTEKWWGIWDTYNGRFIDEKYDEIIPSYDREKTGFLVRKERYWGLLDSAAQQVIPCKYRHLYWKFSLWIAQNEEGSHILSAGGKRHETGPIDRIEPFDNYTEPIVRVSVNQKQGVWDGGQEKWRVPPIYEYVYPLSRTLISVKKEGKVGYLKWDGTDSIPPIYDRLFPIGNYYIASKEGKTGVMATTGAWKIPMEYDTIVIFGAAPNHGLGLRKDGLWQLQLINGPSLSNERFMSFKKVGSTAFVVGLKGKEYLAELAGEKLRINKTFSIDAHQYGSNAVLIYKRNGQYGFWKIEGENWLEQGKICDPIYQEVIPHYNDRYGVFLIKFKGKYGVVDTDGKFLVPPVHSVIDDSHNSILYLKGEDGWYRYDFGRPLKKESLHVDKILDDRNN